MNTPRHYSMIDRLLMVTDNALRTLTTNHKTAGQASPADGMDDEPLSDKERRHVIGLMRVNHTGEVCAQALYQGQSLTAELPQIRETMQQAADDEVDHLRWCEERVQQLSGRCSLLNPLFYGLSFGMGAMAGAIGDNVSLGFIEATEEQVCQHLQKHLQKLPANDHKSRAIIEQMLADEARHQQTARDAGGKVFPAPVKWVMNRLSKVMTLSTYYV